MKAFERVFAALRHLPALLAVPGALLLIDCVVLLGWNSNVYVQLIGITALFSLLGATGALYLMWIYIERDEEEPEPVAIDQPAPDKPAKRKERELLRHPLLAQLIPGDTVYGHVSEEMMIVTRVTIKSRRRLLKRSSQPVALQKVTATVIHVHATGRPYDFDKDVLTTLGHYDRVEIELRRNTIDARCSYGTLTIDHDTVNGIANSADAFKHILHDVKRDPGLPWPITADEVSDYAELFRRLTKDYIRLWYSNRRGDPSPNHPDKTAV